MSVANSLSLGRPKSCLTHCLQNRYIHNIGFVSCQFERASAYPMAMLISKLSTIQAYECCTAQHYKHFYYMEESVLLGTKPLVDSIRHFIQDPSGVFSVCHLCECRIVQWRHDSRLLLLLNWFLPIIKRTLHVGSKI